jgi:ABC-type glycerol-3-phosphate transport system substrate-binding protein
MAIYYNKDLLDRAGIAEAPKNWKEFQAAVEKLVKIDKASGKILQSGTALGTGNNISGFEDILYILFKQSGIDLINKDGAVNFNNTSGNINNDAIAVLNFYTDFANQTRSTYSWNEDMEMALDRFINGSVAFFFGYSYHAPVIKARSPQLNVAVLPMLQLNPEEPINVANYWIQSVTEKSKHKNEAWGLVNYLTHSGATKEYIEKSGRPSALRAYVAKQLDDPNLQPFVSQALVSDSWYHGNDYETTVRAMADMVHQWLLPAPQVGREQEWKKEIINRAAAKISQTL